MTKGLPSDTCYPYTSGQGDSGTCLTACKDGSAKMLTTHKIKSWDYVNGEAAMMAALVNGPIAVAFAVYEDFFSYKTGVYVPNKASGLAGYHAVKMVGYGVTTGPKPQKCAPAPRSPAPFLALNRAAGTGSSPTAGASHGAARATSRSREASTLAASSTDLLTAAAPSPLLPSRTLQGRSVPEASLLFLQEVFSASKFASGHLASVLWPGF
jgi:hypothetical protein